MWGYAVVERWVPGWRTGERLSAAVVVQLVTLQGAFAVLAAAGVFTAATAAVVVVALVALACTSVTPLRRLRSAAAADLATAGRAVTVASPVAKAVGVGLLVLAAAMAARMLVSPPLAWDDLTYHLVKSGSWAGAGSLVSTPAPDAWTYYDHFAAGGEVLGSWTLLASPSGGALGLLALLTWGAVAVAGRAAGRGLGLDEGRATLAAAALATVPAVTVFVESAYVDNLVLLGFLAGLASLLAVRAAPTAGGAALAAAAFGLTAGVKQSMLPVAVLAWAWLAAIGWRHRGTARSASWAAAIAGGVAVAAPWYLRAWVDQGSPMYPFRAPVLGDLLPSNEQLHAVLSGSIAGEAAVEPGPGYVVDALRQTVEVLGDAVPGLNWPPAPLVWLVVAAVGALVLLRDPARRVPAAFLLATVVAVWGPVLLPDSQSLRLWWSAVLGRLLLPAFAAVVLLACSVRVRAVGFVLWAAVALQLLASWQVLTDSWGDLDAEAVGDVAPALVLGGAAALAGGWLVIRSVRTGSARAAAAGVAVVLAGVAGASSATEAARDEVRYDYYDAATRAGAWRVQPLGAAACPWPLWEAVDGADGLRVAVSAGFGEPTGHNNLRSPFLGADLQNELVYVPFSADGSIVDLAPPGADGLVDEDAWLRRIDEEGVDVVALVAPEPPEQAIVEAHPERFELVAESACGEPSRLYRVRSAP